jgi:hypothetical protein
MESRLMVLARAPIEDLHLSVCTDRLKHKVEIHC